VDREAHERADDRVVDDLLFLQLPSQRYRYTIWASATRATLPDWYLTVS
jgi:sulfur transfer protein SufE